ncbi:MAG: GGDEF domain-containing protein [Chloroflexi bacterium]|nr:MAG: GGDEF domain-containing protein [Chloroflexota bacterium]TMF35720.1 MAG: GGDEF domain-containing protein [Chloroflexota bacterium]
MNPGAESGGSYAVDVLGTLASGLGVDSMESGRKALEVVRARSPELVTLSEQTGEDLITTSAEFIDMLLASLRSDMEHPWADFEQRSRDYGRLRAAQGLPLESLIEVLAVYRRATMELLSRPIQGKPHYDEIIALAQSRLEDVTERLTTAIARGYLDHIDEEHRARESEMYGLAAIVTAMGRSLDLMETAEVALVESLAALRLSTGAMWLRERSSYKVAHTVGLDQDQVDQFSRQVGPHVKASASAIDGRSESQVDRMAGPEWNALRAHLRVRGRTVGMMTVGTMGDRVFGASDLLFMAAVADQVAIAVDRARQFASEARTDHLTGLANRREFERVMEREVALAERHNRRLSLMMIDLDNLKRINDRLGHSAGDGALRLVAQQLLRVVRASDVCARVGGDEFAVAMPETDIDRARDVATRLRRAVEHGALGMRAPEHVEVSVGIAGWRGGNDWQAVYKAADEDLYEDKRRRKTVTRWQQEDSPALRILGRSGGRRRASGA